VLFIAWSRGGEKKKGGKKRQGGERVPLLNDLLKGRGKILSPRRKRKERKKKIGRRKGKSGFLLSPYILPSLGERKEREEGRFTPEWEGKKNLE